MQSNPDTVVRITTTPSPMMVGGGEVGGLSYTPCFYPYVLRFTPLDPAGNQLYDLQTVLDEFLTGTFDIYVLAVESSKKDKLHFHIYLESPDALDVVKQKVRDFIYPYYPVRKRGFGTREYNCQEAEFPLKAIMYALKQRGEYHYLGFSQEFIDSCIKSSFDIEPSDFEKEIAELSQEFLDSSMDPYKYAEGLCILYSKYDKRVHFKDIQGIVNSKIIKRDPSQASYLVSKYLSF